MSNHIDAISWAVPTLQNDLNAVTVSITDCYPDRLLESGNRAQLEASKPLRRGV
jgi:hypothetical protein